jgi:protein disulfide-isomerase
LPVGSLSLTLEKKFMKTIALLTLLVIAQLGCAQKAPLTWYTDINEATSVARKENKPMMLFFTGSDWCGWCKRLQKEVFNTSEFEAWAKANVILVELDFPSAAVPQTEALKAQNRALQQQFGVRGYPTCWFVRPEKLSDGKMNLAPIGSKGYEAGGPANWTNTASALLKAN